jgi:hypothetical protein
MYFYIGLAPNTEIHFGWSEDRRNLCQLLIWNQDAKTRGSPATLPLLWPGFCVWSQKHKIVWDIPLDLAKPLLDFSSCPLFLKGLWKLAERQNQILRDIAKGTAWFKVSQEVVTRWWQGHLHWSHPGEWGLDRIIHKVDDSTDGLPKVWCPLVL